MTEVARQSVRRRWLLAGIVATGIWSAWQLDLTLAALLPGEGGIRLAAEFFLHALTPALTYEGDVPVDTPPLWMKVLQAAWATVLFASAAMSLAIAGGMLLGFTASSRLWLRPPRGRHPLRIARLGVGWILYSATRIVITLMRSIHELLWAVLFLAALGLSQLSAVVALALPCMGILAKIFAELVDEAPRGPAESLEAGGASPLQVYLFALVPQALPDILAYVFYRFECALRSSAVLGFFGYPTLGFYMAASFENLHYAEVWTYLLTLALLVALVDWWSGLVRRELAG